MGKKADKKDQYTVVLEEILSQFKIFGETLNHMSNEMDKHDKKFENIESDMRIVKGELALIRHNQVTRDEFKHLENRVLRLERKIS